MRVSERLDLLICALFATAIVVALLWMVLS